MKIQNKYKFTLIAILAINSLCAGSLAIAQSSIQSGTIPVNDCNAICLNLSTPAELALNTPQFLAPEGGVIYIAGNPAIGSQIEIEDAKGDGGFSLDLNITNLSNGTTSIPYTDIGFLTFSEGSTVNNGRYNPTLTALNDQDYSFNNFSDSNLVNPTDFQYFSGTGFTSDSLVGILQDSPTSSSRGTYTSGLAFAIKTPENPEQLGIRDDNFTLNATFTLYTL